MLERCQVAFVSNLLKIPVAQIKEWCCWRCRLGREGSIVCRIDCFGYIVKRRLVEACSGLIILTEACKPMGSEKLILMELERMLNSPVVANQARPGNILRISLPKLIHLPYIIPWTGKQVRVQMAQTVYFRQPADVESFHGMSNFEDNSAYFPSYSTYSSTFRCSYVIQMTI